jgi:hypothetical protein
MPVSADSAFHSPLQFDRSQFQVFVFFCTAYIVDQLFGSVVILIYLHALVPVLVAAFLKKVWELEEASFLESLR